MNNNNDNPRKSFTLFPNAEGNNISARKKNSKVSFKNESNNQLRVYNNTLTDQGENDNNNIKSRKRNLFESNLSKPSNKTIKDLTAKIKSKKKHNFSDSSFDSSSSKNKKNKNTIQRLFCCG